MSVILAPRPRPTRWTRRLLNREIVECRRAILRTGGMDPRKVARIPMKDLEAAVVEQARATQLTLVHDVDNFLPAVVVKRDPILHCLHLVQSGEQTPDEAASLATALTGRLVETTDLGFTDGDAA